MSHVKRAGVTLFVGASCVLSVLPAAFAAGPQQLPEQACNAGTLQAAQNAPTRRSAEAIPHIEHDASLPVLDYCHHFNPAAAPPAGG
jgi:hypothetical protein